MVNLMFQYNFFKLLQTFILSKHNFWLNVLVLFILKCGLDIFCCQSISAIGYM